LGNTKSVNIRFGQYGFISNDVRGDTITALESSLILLSKLFCSALLLCCTSTDNDYSNYCNGWTTTCRALFLTL